MVYLASFAFAFSGHDLPGVQVNLEASRDSSIYSEFTDHSSGAGQFIISGVTKENNRRRGLIHFDIASAVPEGATINFVRLDLVIAKVPDELFVGTTHFLHRATADWGEAGSGGTGRGAPAEAGDATWTAGFFGSSNWSASGGDFVAFASASASVSPTVNDTVGFSSLGLVDDVQLFLDSPASNFGWFVVGNEAFDSNARAYYSSENANVGNRPNLLIDYTPVPEPAWVTLGFGLATVFVVGRKRR